MASRFYDFQYNILIVGSRGVGKTAISQLFVKRNFSLSTAPSKNSLKTYMHVVNGKHIMFRIRQIQEFGKCFYKYYQQAHAIMYIYDVNNINSFNQLQIWLKETKKAVQDAQNITKLLLGSQIDMSSPRSITQDQGRKYAQKHKMHFQECSIKNIRQKSDSPIIELLRLINSDLFIKEKQMTPRKYSLESQYSTAKSEKPEEYIAKDLEGPKIQQDICLGTNQQKLSINASTHNESKVFYFGVFSVLALNIMLFIN